MFAGLYNFLIINNLSAFITFFVGFFAFIIYRLEKNNKEQSSAKIILEEIRAIERDVDRLKNTVDLMANVPTNLSTSGWNNNRHTVVKFLDYDEILQLSQFFERTEILKDILSQWRKHYFSAMEEKSAIILKELAKFTIEDQYPKQKREGLKKNFEDDSYWFEPYIFKDQTKKTLDLIQPISTTTVGEKIKVISNKKWYQFDIG